MKYESDLIHWITEREKVRIRREIEKSPPPWTSDRIIRTVRFCNIRREDDKVTRWLKQHWRDPWSDHPNLAFAMCMARVVNWPETLEYLGFPETWDPSLFVKMMTIRSQYGHKVWTSAYMVTGGYSKGGETKQEIIARVLNDAFPRAAQVKPGYLQDAFDLIAETKGLGTFLAAQVIADLKYTPLLEKAPDWDTFCAPGPGSTKGLNILHERPLEAGISWRQFMKEVWEVKSLISSKTGYNLTAHDTQNCLCEFSKYIRIKYLKGRAKTHFKEPSHA